MAAHGTSVPTQTVLSVRDTQALPGHGGQMGWNETALSLLNRWAMHLSNNMLTFAKLLDLQMIYRDQPPQQLSSHLPRVAGLELRNLLRGARALLGTTKDTWMLWLATAAALVGLEVQDRFFPKLSRFASCR